MRKILVVLFVMLLGFTVRAEASICDLTTVPATPTFFDINGALFGRTVLQGQGTGVFDPFVRVDGGGQPSQQGYNTDGRPVQFDEKTADGFTHAILWSDIPTHTLNNVLYREIILDGAEPGAAGEEGDKGSNLYLNRFEIYLVGSGTQLGFDPDANAGLGFGNAFPAIYTMGLDNAGAANIAWLDNMTGQGKADMYVYLPDSLFSNPTGQYLTLYSQFGADKNKERGASDGGPENWGIDSGSSDGNEVPEPGTLSLLGAGLVGLMGLRRKKS